MIVSFTEGRVRLRLPQLHDPAAADVVKRYIETIEGIDLVEVKTITGSILIQYNPTILPTADLFKQGMAALEKFSIHINVPAEQANAML